MMTEVKVVVRLLAYLAIFISFLLFGFYGLGLYYSVFGRSGLNYDMQTYYDISPGVYVAAEFMFCAFGFLLIIIMLITLRRKDAHYLKILLLIFLVYSLSAVVYEVYLMSVFKGKG